MNLAVVSNPTFSEDEAREVLRDLFGASGSSEFKSLPSFDDQNFRVTTSTGCPGERFVLKFSFLNEDESVIDCQSQMMDMLGKAGILCPRPIYSKNGARYERVKGHLTRLLTFLPGTTFIDGEHTYEACESLGKLVGRMDALLMDFDHPAAHREFKWDLRQTHRVAEFTNYLPTPEDKKIVEHYLDLFHQMKPKLDKQRMSIIHGDTNECNVLIDGKQAAGIIDFGDCIYTNSVCEPAILMMYLIIYFSDYLEAACSVLKGYQSTCPLKDEELELLFPLICSRLCMSVTYSSYAYHSNPENEYIIITRERALKALRYFYDNVTPEKALAAFKTVADELK